MSRAIGKRNFTAPIDLNKPRSAFNKGFKHSTTLQYGKVIPIYAKWKDPGETSIIDIAEVIRMVTPLVPSIDDLYLDVNFFAVPIREVWDHWREFYGENRESYWTNKQLTVTIPKIVAPQDGFKLGTLMDYLIKTSKATPENGKRPKYNALKLRAYAHIWNVWYRDENTMDPIEFSKNDIDTYGENGQINQTPNNIMYWVDQCGKGGYPAPACRRHDYFSSCLPSPQRGDPSTLALGKWAPVVTRDQEFTDATGSIKFANRDGSWPSNNTVGINEYGQLVPGKVKGYTKVGQAATEYELTQTGFQQNGSDIAIPKNLWTDLSAATAVTINQLRFANAYQEYLEKNAIFGTRINEYLLGHWGVRNEYLRTDDPEFLGGRSVMLNMNQVLNVAGGQDALGRTGAYSLTNDVGHYISKTFLEPTIVMGLATIRTDHTYAQGVDREDFQDDILDMYDPIFANLGEQPVYNREIFESQDESKDNQIFGYNQAWEFRRCAQNKVSGALRPALSKEGLPEETTQWIPFTYADNYETTPTLSAQWMQEDDSIITRTFAIQPKKEGDYIPQFLASFQFMEKSVQIMPVYAKPSLSGRI